MNPKLDFLATVLLRPWRLQKGSEKSGRTNGFIFWTFFLRSTSRDHCVVFRNLTRYTMGKSEHFTMPKPRLYHITAQTAAGRGKKSHSNAIMWQFASVCIDLPIAQCWWTMEWSYSWNIFIFQNFFWICLNPNYYFPIWNFIVLIY